MSVDKAGRNETALGVVGPGPGARQRLDVGGTAHGGETPTTNRKACALGMAVSMVVTLALITIRSGGAFSWAHAPQDDPITVAAVNPETPRTLCGFSRCSSLFPLLVRDAAQALCEIHETQAW